MYLVAEYSGINSSVSTNPLNMNIIVATLNSKKIEESTIAVIEIFFISSGFFIIGGIK